MFTLAQREGKVKNVPYFPMSKESDPREGFVERPEFEKLRAEMPVNLHAALTFCYETGCRTGAMKQIVWPWVKLDKNEIHLPPGVIKNRKPLILPLSKELSRGCSRNSSAKTVLCSTRRTSVESGLRLVLNLVWAKRPARGGTSMRGSFLTT